MKQSYFPIIGLVLVLLSVGLACKVPFSQPEKATQIEEPVASVTEASEEIEKPEEEIVIQAPPRLVESTPVSGSTLAFNQSIVLYFNQPMSDQTVIDYLTFEPSIDLKLVWLDDSTLEITPIVPLPLDETLTLKLGKGIQAPSGVSADEDIVLTFQTPSPLLITEFIPKEGADSVNPSGVVMVSFNQPVVTLGEGAAPEAFVITPEVEGTGEWLNTSTYVFTPEPSLGGGMEFMVSLNRGLTSLFGAPLELTGGQSQNWTFSTSFPSLLSAEPFEKENIPLDAQFSLTFNQTMAPQSIAEHFRFIDSDGQDVLGVINWNDDYSTMTFTPDAILSRNNAYQLLLGAEAASAGGTEIGVEHSFEYQTVGVLFVSNTTPELSAPLQIYTGYSSIHITFSNPLKEMLFLDLVRFAPDIGDKSIYLIDENTLVVSGYFAGKTEYTMTVSDKIEDRWGQTMDLPYSTTFRTSPVQPNLSIPLLQYGEQALFMTTGDSTIPGRATNLDALNITSETLTMEAFSVLALQPELLWDYHPQEGQFWSQILDLPADVNFPVEVSVQPTGEPLATGVYFFEFDSPALDYGLHPFLLVVSDVNVVIKRSENQLFIWAVDLRLQSPLGDAKLNVHLGESGELLYCVTDAFGTCEITLPEAFDPFESIFVHYGEPGDENFAVGIEGWSMGVSGWDFDIETYRAQAKHLAYIYTDRAIYRPGQQVNFRVILREVDNARYVMTDYSQLHLEVYGGYTVESGEVPLLETIPISLSPFGSGSGTYVLPEDADPGYYSLRISEISDSYLDFQVAEYRKPQIDLLARFADVDTLHGDDLSVSIQASYFFGAPASNLPIHWTLYVQDSYFALPYGYHTGKLDWGWTNYGYHFGMPMPLGSYLLEGDGTTTAEGNYEVVIAYADLADKLDMESYQQINFEVTLKDESEIPVSAQASLELHPEPYVIGIRPEQWSGIAGNAMGFSIQTSDWKKFPTANISLTASFQKVTWKQEEDVLTGMRRSVPQYKQEGSASLITDSNGQARIIFTPSEPGTFLLTVRGGQSVSQVFTWVGGPGSTSWPNLPNQQLVITSDKQNYSVGETAGLFIPNPFESGLALITVERAEVMRSYVIPIEGSYLEYELDILPTDAPNVYVGVTLLNDPENGDLDFRQGYINLDVDPEEFTLQVQILWEEIQYYPGDEMLMSLLVSDLYGNSVEGEFSLSLVDKAVLALAKPNAEGILEAFYGTQSLGVVNSASLAAYVGRFPTIGADGIGGGAGLPEPIVRQDFKDTAFWSGTILTDENGRAEILITVPDNLTTWVATVRGVTKDTLVGETEIEVIVSKDLILSPVTPRFLVAGDRVQISTLVHNLTSESLPVDVSLQTAGFLLDDEGSQLQRIVLDPGEVKRLNWDGVVQNVDSVELIFVGQSGDLYDATTPEMGAIPVLHYIAPQSYATSGYLDEAREVLEGIGFPRSFDPTGGQLTVELAPSLGASIFKEMQVLQTFHEEFNETLISQLMPNVEMLKAIREFGLKITNLEDELIGAIFDNIDRLTLNQNGDGSWGWTSGVQGDVFLSSYVLFGLSLAEEAGFFIAPEVIENAQEYLLSSLPLPHTLENAWQFDRLVFQHYALQQSGYAYLDSSELYEYRDLVNPWANALLAQVLESQDPGSERSRALVEDLLATAGRTATGMYWEDEYSSKQNYSSTNFNTAVVLYTLAKLDPADGAVPLAERFLSLHRSAVGGWASSYETAWVLLALTEVMRGTGELQADYAFSASINGSEIISGEASGVDSLTTIVSTTAISDLQLESPNILEITRQEGTGRLNYRAYLQVYQSVEDVRPLQKGLSIERKYVLLENRCALHTCEDVDTYSLAQDQKPILVQLTITAPTEMYYLVVEDWIPAGTELVDSSLAISPQVNQYGQEGDLEPVHNFWDNIYFHQPVIYDDHIRWVAEWLPAGTYTLTYQITPYLSGEFQVLPAHVYQYYFPDVSGGSAGQIFNVVP